MADMANIDEVRGAWKQIQEWTEGKEKIIPVTYMNSTADLKAFCGENGGIVCTSSNAQKIFEWAYARGNKILFFPDEHLGRNTGKKLNILPAEMALWNPKLSLGGIGPSDVLRSRLILWAGHFPVHMEFKVRDIQHVRKFFPGCQVVVHPECEKDVVDSADASG